MSVKHSARSGGIIGISFRFFFNMKVCFEFSLELPHQGNSNEYTQYTIFSIKRKITLNHPKSVAMRFFFLRTQEQVRNSLVNQPSVFEPSKFYCITGYTVSNYVIQSDIALRLYKH